MGKLLFSFNGRINRQPYWLFQLGMLILVFVLAYFFNPESDLSSIVLPLFYLFYFFTSLAVMVKRWHDRDKSGWWVLIGLIPIIGGIWAWIELGFLKGTEGPNRFGPDPLTRDTSTAVDLT